MVYGNDNSRINNKKSMHGIQFFCNKKNKTLIIHFQF